MLHFLFISVRQLLLFGLFMECLSLYLVVILFALMAHSFEVFFIKALDMILTIEVSLRRIDFEYLLVNILNNWIFMAFFKAETYPILLFLEDESLDSFHEHNFIQ